MRTVDRLTRGILSGTGAVVTTAAVETLIGLSLITGVGLRLALVALAGALVGFMAPIVLIFEDTFPNGTPTLEAQYILKDIILAAACAVVAARALGARYVADQTPPTSTSRPPKAPARRCASPGRPTSATRRRR
jgi:putative oxidoreductase